MSTKDLKMESIADLMWTEEEEADPNGAVADLGVNCGGGSYPPVPNLNNRVTAAKFCR